MPIVQVYLARGRDEETRARLTREIANVVAEVTVNPITEVHVLLNEYDGDDWGKGVTTVARRGPRAPGAKVTRAEYASISEIEFDPALEQEYLDFRRDIIHPRMAACSGFVDALLLRLHDRPSQYRLVIRWLAKEDAAGWSNSQLHEETRQDALRILPKPLYTYGADIVHIDRPMIEKD